MKNLIICLFTTLFACNQNNCESIFNNGIFGNINTSDKVAINIDKPFTYLQSSVQKIDMVMIEGDTVLLYNKK